MVKSYYIRALSATHTHHGGVGLTLSMPTFLMSKIKIIEKARDAEEDLGNHYKKAE